MRLFTKRFFTLSSMDQAAIVDAAIRDIKHSIAIAADHNSLERLSQMRKRLVRKAVEYGVISDEPTSVADLAIDTTKDEWVET